MPYSVFKKPEPKRNNQGFILGLLILGLLAFFMAGQMGFINLPDRDGNYQPNEIIVIEGDSVEPDNGGVNLSECVLLVIRDKRQLNEELDYTLTMVDDEFWDEAETKVKNLEFVSPEDDQAKQFLKRNNLEHPVVCLIDSNTKTVLWQIALPKGGTDPIKEKLFNE